MEIHEILESLKADKISVNNAKKLLSLYSIEEIEGFAKIDINRRIRRGIPEVIFAETKELDEIKKIIKKTLEKSNSVMVSRIKKEDNAKILAFAKKLKVKIKTGKKSSTLLLFKKPIKFHGGKVGILTAGTSDIGVAEPLITRRPRVRGPGFRFRPRRDRRAPATWSRPRCRA